MNTVKNILIVLFITIILVFVGKVTELCIMHPSWTSMQAFLVASHLDILYKGGIGIK
jgi:hypothetical protein